MGMAVPVIKAPRPAPVLDRPGGLQPLWRVQSLEKNHTERAEWLAEESISLGGCGSRPEGEGNKVMLSVNRWTEAGSAQTLSSLAKQSACGWRSVAYPGCVSHACKLCSEIS